MSFAVDFAFLSLSLSFALPTIVKCRYWREFYVSLKSICSLAQDELSRVSLQTNNERPTWILFCPVRRRHRQRCMRYFDYAHYHRIRFVCCSKCIRCGQWSAWITHTDFGITPKTTWQRSARMSKICCLVWVKRRIMSSNACMMNMHEGSNQVNYSYDIHRNWSQHQYMYDAWAKWREHDTKKAKKVRRIA